MAAKKSSLETLHEMLTELFMEDIKICRSEGIPMSASDNGMIILGVNILYKSTGPNSPGSGTYFIPSC